MLGARKKASILVRNELSLAFDILLVERMARNFSTNHGVKKGETHITFDLTVELLTASTRRDSIHNLLPYCNVISLR